MTIRKLMEQQDNGATIELFQRVEADSDIGFVIDFSEQDQETRQLYLKEVSEPLAYLFGINLSPKQAKVFQKSSGVTCRFISNETKSFKDDSRPRQRRQLRNSRIHH